MKDQQIKIPIEPHFAGDYHIEYDGKYVTLHGRDRNYKGFTFDDEIEWFEKMVLIPIVIEARNINPFISKVTDTEIIVTISSIPKRYAKEKDVLRLLKRAEIYHGKMKSCCGAISIFLQPHFSHEISVEYQPGDRFVVIWEDDFYKAPNNVPVAEVLENIKHNQDYYIDTVP